MRTDLVFTTFQLNAARVAGQLRTCLRTLQSCPCCLVQCPRACSRASPREARLARHQDFLKKSSKVPLEDQPRFLDRGEFWPTCSGLNLRLWCACEWRRAVLESLACTPSTQSALSLCQPKCMPSVLHLNSHGKPNPHLHASESHQQDSAQNHPSPTYWRCQLSPRARADSCYRCRQMTAPHPLPRAHPPEPLRRLHSHY